MSRDFGPDIRQRLELMLKNRGRGGFPGGGGKGGLPAGAALIVLGLGGWAISESLFNGRSSSHRVFTLPDAGSDLSGSGRWSSRDQILQTKWCEEGDLQRR